MVLTQIVFTDKLYILVVPFVANEESCTFFLALYFLFLLNWTFQTLHSDLLKYMRYFGFIFATDCGQICLKY